MGNFKKKIAFFDLKRKFRKKSEWHSKNLSAGSQEKNSSA
jgi:hypothetical protein